MIDVYSFIFLGFLAAAGSYLALRPARETDPDNIYTGGFAFIAWIAWSFSAFSVEFGIGGGETAVRSYPPLAYIGFAMVILMLIGLLEEVFDRLGIDVREELGV